MRIFLYEPNTDVGNRLCHSLKRAGYDVTWIPDYMEADARINETDYDASLIEIDNCVYSGLALIKKWFSNHRNLLCISIYTSQDTSAGFRAHCFGSQELYEIEHGNIDKLNLLLAKYKILARKPQVFKHTSEAFNKAIQDLRNLINNNQPVLLIGKPGCGKSYLAEHVHHNGTKQDFQYEEIKCESLDVENGMEIFLGVEKGFNPSVRRSRKGILEEANEKELLYLEHIHLLPKPLQEVLLKVIERREFRRVGSNIVKPFMAHIVVSCNDIAQINNERFDRGLYNLISHNIVRVPSLAENTADIITNSIQIVEDFCAAKGIVEIPAISEGAQIMLCTHSWPGNYRELKSCLESAVTCCSNGIIDSYDLKITRTDEEEALPADRRGLIIFYLKKYHGKKGGH